MKPTKLVDLDPSWLRDGEGRHGMGVSFRCPVHPDGSCHQGVWFRNPINGRPPATKSKYNNGVR